MIDRIAWRVWMKTWPRGTRPGRSIQPQASEIDGLGEVPGPGKIPGLQIKQAMHKGRDWLLRGRGSGMEGQSWTE